MLAHKFRGQHYQRKEFLCCLILRVRESRIHVRVSGDRCGVTYRLLAGRHRPDEAVEGAMWGWPQIEVCLDCLDYSWVHLRQPLDRCLECEASGNVLPQKGNNFPLFLA